MNNSNEKSGFKMNVGTFIIANAIIWGAVIVAVALALRGTGYMDKLLPILGAGAAFSLFLSGALAKKK